MHFLERGLREGFGDLVEEALAPRSLDAGLDGLGEGLGVAPGGVEDNGDLFLFFGGVERGRGEFWCVFKRRCPRYRKMQA